MHQSKGGLELEGGGAAGGRRLTDGKADLQRGAAPEEQKEQLVNSTAQTPALGSLFNGFMLVTHHSLQTCPTRLVTLTTG